MRFCPTCGAPVELKRPAGDTLERHVCSACGEIHYRNPKIVVGAVCSWQDRILLCRRAIEPRAGFWAVVPAGYLEIGESTEDGAMRETFEEAARGSRSTGCSPSTTWSGSARCSCSTARGCSSPDVAAGLETLELDLFEWAAIPWAELAFPSVH